MQEESGLENRSDGDISLIDILKFLGRHVGLISAITVIGGGAGVGVGRIVPQVWEATSIVVIGRVGNELIEPLQNAAERVGTSGFAQRVIHAVGAPVREDMVSASLKGAPRGTDLVAITVRGPTSEDATRYAAAARDVMILTQGVKMTKAEDVLQSEASFADKALERAVKRRDSWAGYAKGMADGSTKPRLAEVLLLKEMIDRNDAQADEARKQSEKFQRSLRPSETFPSRALDDGMPVVKKVFPSRTKFVGGGVIFGVLLGGLCALVLELRSRGRLKAAAR
ncbi:Wzz/FepE/Etk N-terminal domain-containing protein [Pandoraea soli]|uniref:Polysaccharide chain length determinant N-terminal domain-containing protein n=1 Tax=Pandoraea soli TaxID=2508293 RepID=A0ABY6W8S5_9BURK|nr:Wzz/FepE/Etk N-terminal domain-containing protein [Pandoraea soli]VVE32634.1 hypothetical protein PSO31014_03718 [Pandoraea soli]